MSNASTNSSSGSTTLTFLPITPELLVAAFIRRGAPNPGPWFAVREWDLKVIRKNAADNVHMEALDPISGTPRKISRSSEQAIRASIRQVILQLGLRADAATREEVRLLKVHNVIGKRAPSCSLLTGEDMATLLASFGKDTEANDLRKAMRQHRLAGTSTDGAADSTTARALADEQMTARAAAMKERVKARTLLSAFCSGGDTAPSPKKLPAKRSADTAFGNPDNRLNALVAAMEASKPASSTTSAPTVPPSAPKSSSSVQGLISAIPAVTVASVAPGPASAARMSQAMPLAAYPIAMNGMPMMMAPAPLSWPMSATSVPMPDTHGKPSDPQTMNSIQQHSVGATSSTSVPVAQPFVMQPGMMQHSASIVNQSGKAPAGPATGPAIVRASVVPSDAAMQAVRTYGPAAAAWALSPMERQQIAEASLNHMVASYGYAFTPAGAVFPYQHAGPMMAAMPAYAAAPQMRMDNMGMNFVMPMSADAFNRDAAMAMWQNGARSVSSIATGASNPTAMPPMYRQMPLNSAASTVVTA